MRKAVSIRGETYDQVKAYCDKHDLRVAQFINDLCEMFFEPKVLAPTPPIRKRESLDHRDIVF